MTKVHIYQASRARDNNLQLAQNDQNEAYLVLRLAVGVTVIWTSWDNALS